MELLLTFRMRFKNLKKLIAELIIYSNRLDAQPSNYLKFVIMNPKVC